MWTPAVYVYISVANTDENLRETMYYGHVKHDIWTTKTRNRDV